MELATFESATKRTRVPEGQCPKIIGFNPIAVAQMSSGRGV